MDEHNERARECVEASVRAGFQSAGWAALFSAPPTLLICRTVPWFKHNVNHTGQTLIISASCIAAYFITSEKTLLACTKSKSWAAVQAAREGQAKP